MDLELDVTGDFLFKIAKKITWNQINYGYINRFITEESIFNFNMLRLNNDSSDLEYDLSMIRHDDKMSFYKILSDLCLYNKNIDNDIWIYILLNLIDDKDIEWKYKFDLFEYIYCYFNTPKELELLYYYHRAIVPLEEKIDIWNKTVNNYKKIYAKYIL